MKSMVLGHLKSKHNYRKKIRQNSLSFQLVIFFERKGLSTRTVSFRKTNFKDVITYFKIILEENSFKFSPKQMHLDSRKFLSLCYDKTWTVFDYIEKDTQYSLMIIRN